MKVLIVDDNSDDRRLLRYVVENKGHECIEAEDGLEGLRMVKIHAPDLIISDALMPVMDGFQFLKSIKEDERLRSIPFIFYSAIYKADKDVDLAIALGAEAYILKPKEPADLWDEVEIILRGQKNEKVIATKLITEEEDYLKRYSHVVAAKLEEKVRELEETLAKRKRAEKALKKSERVKSELLEKLNEAQHIGMIGSWEWNLQTNHIWWSDETYRIFGVTPQDFVPSFEANDRFIHPDDFARHSKSFEHSLQTGEPLDIDIRLVANDGLPKHCHNKGKIIYDDSGQPIFFAGTIMDITERKQAEEERLAHLRFLESMDKVNRTIQGASDIEQMMSDVLDVVLSIFDCDRVWFFYPCDPDAPSFRVPMEITKPEYPGAKIFNVDVPMSPDMAQNLREALESAGPVTYTVGTEKSINKVSAEQFGVKSMMMVALYPKSGKPWVFGVHQCSYPRVWTREEKRLFQEISRRLSDAIASLLILRDLQESENRYRRITEGLTDYQYSVRVENGRPVETTQSTTCAVVTGYTIEEFAADPYRWIRMVMPEDRESVQQHAGQILAGKEVPPLEHRIIRKDGTARWVCDTTILFKDASGNLLSYDGVIKDITDRKRAEDQIRHLKNYLSNIIDSMPSVLVGMDNNQTVTQWNRRAEEFTGTSAAEAVGKHIAELLPDFSPWIAAMGSDTEKNRPSSIDKLLIEKEGERRFYDLMFYPLITNGVEGAVLRIEDVTERTRIQELMIQTEKMMSLGGLAAGMAHEINNPLGIIAQAAQNIERRVSPDFPANRKVAEEAGVSLEGMQDYFERRQISQFIDSIREASLRASRIIINVLRFSRSTETTMQPASLSQIIDQALEFAASDYDLKKKYDFRSIEIVRDYADVPEVPMVSVEIEQVILNLLKNAAQAMAANPPERNPRIILRLRHENRYAVLEVEDNGPGMPEDIRRRVFEPFFTTKDPGIGTGLGLSVSYMIVTQNHKGLMEVESTPGKGTCFKVRLPMAKEGIHG